MEKTFQSFEELLEFDFSKLEPSKSNYLRLIPTDGILPTVKKEFHPKRWHGITRDKSNQEILFEITPLWLTVTICEQREAKREHFEIRKRDVKSLIREIFEF